MLLFFAIISQVVVATVENEGWMLCTREAGFCKLMRRSIVRYGANIHWITKPIDPPGFTCDTSEFGRDPVVGVYKQCYVRDVSYPLIGFYQMFGGYKNYSLLLAPIVNEQMQFLYTSDLLAKTENLYISYVGIEFENISMQHLLGDNTVMIGLLANKTSFVERHHTGYETLSLAQLWKFCRKSENVERRVYYIHSKGSYTPSHNNDVLRRNLMYGVASPCCHVDETGGDVCGFRSCPTPHLHFPGNMWTASCRHVARLINPNDFMTAMNKIQRLVPNCYEGAIGAGRFSSEHWIASHPAVTVVDILPVDVSPIGTNSYYCWGYGEVAHPTPFSWHPTCESFPRSQLTFDPHLLSAWDWGNINNCTSAWAKTNEYSKLYGDDWFLSESITSLSTPCRWFNMTYHEAKIIIERESTKQTLRYRNAQEYVLGFKGEGELFLQKCTKKN